MPPAPRAGASAMGRASPRTSTSSPCTGPSSSAPRRSCATSTPRSAGARGRSSCAWRGCRSSTPPPGRRCARARRLTAASPGRGLPPVRGAARLRAGPRAPGARPRLSARERIHQDHGDRARGAAGAAARKPARRAPGGREPCLSCARAGDDPRSGWRRCGGQLGNDQPAAAALQASASSTSSIGRWYASTRPSRTSWRAHRTADGGGLVAALAQRLRHQSSAAIHLRSPAAGDGVDEDPRPRCRSHR